MTEKKQNRIFLLIAFFVPLLVAGLIRYWDIGLRPFHSDEGVNTHFLLKLFNNNYYHYNPANYHGPFLYYIGLIPFYILGLSDFSYRFMPALFGVMLIALIYPLRRRIGLMGVLTAGLFIAISPACSFFARDTIHETYLIFFSLALVVSFFLYSETKKVRYILFGASSIAFTITVKETYIVTFAVFIGALAIAYFCEIIFIKKEHRLQLFKDVFVSFGRDCWKRKYYILIGIALFLLINFLFYSSFFTYYEGVSGIISTLMIWTKTGTHSGGHAKPFIYYSKILLRYELPMAVLALAGFYYVYREKRKFAIFMASWTLLIFLAYSIIPYKTPWLIINVLPPLAIMAGIFVNGITQSIKQRWHKFTFYPTFVAIFGFFLYLSIMLNFVNYDDDREDLVYVQTQRDIYNLIDTIDLLAKTAGNDMTISVVSKSYWPLPWYLRDYKNAKFWGFITANPNAPIILVDKKHKKELEEKLKGKYETKRFVLRPSVWVLAYIQKGLYDAVYGNEVALKKQEELIVKVSKNEVENGLVGKYYDNAECLGKPFLEKVEKDHISFAYHKPSQRLYRSPFGIEWKGYIFIEKSGTYQFATKSDDGSNIYIDGEIVVDNSGFHAQRHISNIIFLKEGFHYIKINYFDGGGGAVMDLLWKKPGQSEKESLIPGNVLFHKIEK